MATAPDSKVLTQRLRAAADAAAEAGIDALLVTPGPDLRYLIGYHAVALHRLTCLMVPSSGEACLVVPRLEHAAAEASGATDVVSVVADEETDDAFALVAALIHDVLGAEASTVAVSDRMWAEHVLRLRETVPHARQ